MKQELNAGQKHIIKLINRDKNGDGWSKVSNQLFPFLSKDLPKELIQFRGEIDSYEAKLTKDGESVLFSMAWL